MYSLLRPELYGRPSLAFLNYKVLDDGRNLIPVRNKCSLLISYFVDWLFSFCCLRSQCLPVQVIFNRLLDDVIVTVSQIFSYDFLQLLVSIALQRSSLDYLSLRNDVWMLLVNFWDILLWRSLSTSPLVGFSVLLC